MHLLIPVSRCGSVRIASILPTCYLPFLTSFAVFASRGQSFEIFTPRYVYRSTVGSSSSPHVHLKFTGFTLSSLHTTTVVPALKALFLRKLPAMKTHFFPRTWCLEDDRSYLYANGRDGEYSETVYLLSKTVHSFTHETQVKRRTKEGGEVQATLRDMWAT